MGMTQPQKVDKDLHALLPNNPFVPPKGDVCYIHKLPPELLSHIFSVGAADNDGEEEDDMEDYWDRLRLTENADDSDSHGSGASSKAASEEEDDESDGEDDETDDADSDTSGSSDFAPPWPPFQIVVSHVCRHWRNVALSTPTLWTTIVVVPEARPPYDLVTTMLERSKGVPIDIYVNCEPDEPDDGNLAAAGDAPSDADLEVLYDMLTPHVHRWRTIEVSVSEYHHMFVFLNAVSDPLISAASQLTTLQLYHHEETEEFDNFGYPSLSRSLTLFGGVAPCLTCVVLWGVHVDWDQPWIASASKLVELELAFHAEDVRPTWAQLTTILRSAAALQKLSLRMSGPSGEPHEWTIEPTPTSPRDLNAPILLSKATDFVLAFHSPARAIGLLQKFAFPALKHLVLDFDSGDYTELVDVLIGPATSMSPPSSHEQPRSLLNRLESLKLAGLPCHSESIEKLYGELQNLTSLNVSLSYLDEQFLDLLCTSCTLAGRGDVWLPRLTTLYVSGTSGDVLRKVVDMRKGAGVPLASLYVEESCDLMDADVKWFKENLATFELFEGSDDEDAIVAFEDLQDEDVDVWSDLD